ncbi:hemin uptake protein HemP [Methylomicrobium lacus]|uniref:hemin uptake protein HemP n=1 Tax=Methylomicrobium lacus TaxID=136992 RepID=UPI0035A8C468
MKNSKDPRHGDAVPKDTHNERRSLSSGALFGTRNEIVIVHNDEEYRLRITSNGKLILTK